MKKFLFYSLFFIIAAKSNAQEVISGVFVDNKLTFENKELILNGAGIRDKMWIELYVGSLYVPYKIKSEKELYELDDYFAMRIDIVSPRITSEVLIEAIENGFKNSTKDKIDLFRDRIEFMKGFFKEEIVVGNSFILFYNPVEKTTSIFKNGLNLGSVDGEDFKVAFFGIWFCDKPASKKLKDKMLGR